MMDKKITRKDFILSVLSVTALLVASKVPKIINNNKVAKTKGNNTYGNYSYGGNSKNA
ncbi:MAG: hypothetical protein NTU81_02230 [Candidatus Nomurabacteria bacterium]|nr:hypothetical protein [Candidatus Nomurabacteria bacterium]